MKKLLVVLMLAMASVANAEFVFNSSGLGDVAVGGSISFSLVAPDVTDQGTFYVGITSDSMGGAHFDLTSAVIEYLGVPSTAGLDSEYAGDLGVNANYLTGYFTDTVEPIDDVVGTLLSGIALIGDVAGEITIVGYNGDLTPMFSQTVMVTPEPITMVLLGLGGLMLRRRK
jgi:hypothetical protein